MGRIKGNTGYASNFEPLITGPVDARLTITGGRPAILEDATWAAADGGKYLYNGMFTAVWDSADDEDNGIFILRNVNKYAEGAGWLHIPTTTYVDTAISNASVDLSPYATINWVNTNFVTKTSLTSTLSSYATQTWVNTTLNTRLGSYYTKTEVDTKISTVYKFKGSVANIAELLKITSAQVGDAYNVVSAFTLLGKPYPAGTNVVCVSAFTGSGASVNAEANWDALGGTVDLSIYQLTSPFVSKQIVVDNGIKVTQAANNNTYLDLKRFTATGSGAGKETSRAVALPLATSQFAGLCSSNLFNKLNAIDDHLTKVLDPTYTFTSAKLNFERKSANSGGTVQTTSNSVTIAAATTGAAGVMSKDDKVKLNGILYILTNTSSVTHDKNSVLVVFERYDANIQGLSTVGNTFTINAATKEKAGVMTNFLFNKLDLIQKYLVGVYNVVQASDSVRLNFSQKDANTTFVDNTNQLSIPLAQWKTVESVPTFLAGAFGKGVHIFDIYDSSDVDGSLIEFKALQEISLSGGLILEEIRGNNVTKGVSINVDKDYIRGTSLSGLVIPAYNLLTDVTSADSILAAIGKLLAEHNSSHWSFAGKMYLSTVTPDAASLFSAAIYTDWDSGDTLQLDNDNFIVKRTYFSSNKSYNYEIAIDKIDCGTY